MSLSNKPGSLLLTIRGWDEAPWLERFRRHLPDREIVSARSPFDREAIGYVASWYHAPGSLADLPRLQAIFSLGAGVDHLVGDTKLPPVPLVRVVDPDLTARMSEYVVMHCLMHLRGAWALDANQRQGLWHDDKTQPAARDVRIGIMGLGVLGQDAAAKLKVMGFDVAGWSRNPKSDCDIPAFAGEGELPAFLARTDILVVLLPLTPDTRGLLGRRLFAGLAQDGRLGGPVLINAGRGGLQVEADILRALDEGVLLAASLDVFETEPLPSTSPLWSHPRVHVTPHNAAMSDPEAIASAIAGQIRRKEAGDALTNVIDRATGY